MMTMPANGNDPNPDASFPFLIHVNPSLISCATRRTAAAVSYKEASEDEATDSEDLLEFEYDESQAATTAAAAEEEEKCETIERILAQRAGKKGCTGNQTTIYAIEENGFDPNAGFDEKQCPDAEAETQFLIKWKGWSIRSLEKFGF